jgi:hypothetical protein
VAGGRLLLHSAKGRSRDREDQLRPGMPLRGQPLNPGRRPAWLFPG